MPSGKPGKKTPMGPTLKANLIRLGRVELIVPATELANEIGEKGPKTITRQRISALFNAVFIEDGTIEMIAKGLGVKPSELTREVQRKDILDGVARALDKTKEFP